MPVKKTKSGSYQARFEFNRKEYSKTFKTSREAKHWESETKANLGIGKIPVDLKDKRKLTDLVETWNDLHGHTLKSNNTYNALLRMCEEMGDPRATNFKAEDFINYRKKRLADNKTENMVNHELTYLKGMFNVLIRLMQWNQPNPLEHVQKIKQYDKKLRYLEKDEIKKLLFALEDGKRDGPRLVAELSLSTGMRWNEANQLRRENLIPSQNKITITKTKNTKERTVLVSPELMKKLLDTGSSSGRIFSMDYYKSFMNAVERAKIDLPRGQGARVTRHTFASWYMINGGKLEALQQILGHGTILMTMKYAHLAPDFLETMLVLNPMETLNEK